MVSVVDFRLTKAVACIRAHGLKGCEELVANFILPFLIYSYSRGSLGDELALIVASMPPTFWSIITFIREGKVDTISVIVLSGIALSLLAFFGGGGVKFLQLRENLVTGFVALIFLGSVAIGRPLIYPLARAGLWRTEAEKVQTFEALRGDRSVPSLHGSRYPVLGIRSLGRVRAQLRAGLHGLDQTLPLDQRSHQLCNCWDTDCLDILVPTVVDSSRRCAPRN
jgi:hypothetical protein